MARLRVLLALVALALRLRSALTRSSELPPPPPWFAATGLGDAGTLLAWPLNEVSSLTPPSTGGDGATLCFSLDHEPAVRCQPARATSQVLPTRLSPGSAHVLHATLHDAATGRPLWGEGTPRAISFRCLVSDAGSGARAGSGPRVLFLSPAYGAVVEIGGGGAAGGDGDVISGDLDLRISVMGGAAGGALAAWPPGASVVFSIAGQTEFEVADETEYLNLAGMEPGTHHVAAVVVDRASRRALGPETETLVEVVVASRGGAFDRLRRLPPRHDPAAFDRVAYTFHDPPAPSSPPTSPLPAAAAGAKATRSPLRVSMVGTLKFDGQRTIWLQQMRLLDRARFALRVVTFAHASHESDDGAARLQVCTVGSWRHPHVCPGAPFYVFAFVSSGYNPR